MGRLSHTVKALMLFVLAVLWTSPSLAEPSDLQAFENNAAALFQAGKYEDALSVARQWVEAAEREERSQGRPGPATAAALTGEAWYALFADKPEAALAASERAVSLAPGETEIEINRAHALLFLGRADAAQAIYLSRKGTTLTAPTKWEHVIAKDFADLRQRGLGRPAMDAIEAALAAAPDSPFVIGERADEALQQGKLQEALQLARNYAVAVAGRYGEYHTAFAAALRLQGQVLLAMKERREAEKLLRQALAIDVSSTSNEDRAVALDLLALVNLLTPEERLDEAASLLSRAVGIMEKQPGPDHPVVSLLLELWAELLLLAERPDEAEPICRRALTITANAVGADHLDTAKSVYLLAQIVSKQKRFEEAEALFRRALAIRERANEAPGMADSLGGLARTLEIAYRFTEAEKLYRRAIDLTEKTLGPDHPTLANRIGSLGYMFAHLNRNAEAEALFRRALAIDEKVHGSDHPDVASRLNSLGRLLLNTNRMVEAETAIRRALAISEAARGPNHPDVAVSYYNLAALLYATNRSAEAEPLVRHAIAMSVKGDAGKGFEEAMGLNTLAVLLVDTKRYAEAEPVLRRAIGLLEANVGPSHPMSAAAYSNLAVVLSNSGRSNEAEPLIRRSLAIMEKIFGPDHASVAVTLNNLAFALQKTGDHAQAEALLVRAQRILEQSAGLDHPDVATALTNLVGIKAERQDWQSAIDLMRRVTSIRIASARQMRGSAGGGEKRLLAQSNNAFREFVLYAYRANSANTGVMNEAFEMAQRALTSEAADALARSTARFAAGSGFLAELVREQQDLVHLRDEADNRMLAALAEADRADIAAQRAELNALNAKIEAISNKLAVMFPEYAVLANPQPLSLVATQALLKSDEALIVFLDVAKNGAVPEAGFAWLITQREVKWVEIPAGTVALAEHVTALRCGLTFSAWEGDGAAQCQHLSGGNFRKSALPPFDVARAHALYTDLFGQFSEQIKGKRLLIAPSGALTALPFQILVTEPSTSTKERFSLSSYFGVAWLGRSHAITIVPSVASLAALRKAGVREAAAEPFIGFGDPVLTGGGYCDEIPVPTHCPGAGDVATRSQTRSGSGWLVASVGQFFRGGIGNPTQICRMCPLPDTAHELKCVAESLDARPESVNVGAAATETAVKSAKLARYRIVHFATHGLLSGEAARLNGGLPEPALVLTPPETPSDNDDGLLTASEVTQLKLNADWVILSACNTAGSAQPGGETLSGLAQAFFYAGARTLLLSHWPVDTNAATLLTSTAFKEQRDAPTISSAEAMRRAAVALMDDRREPWHAHPSVWGPFVVVGGN